MRFPAIARTLAGLILAAAGVAHGEAPMVAARFANALVLKSDGTVVGWGSNSDGQLGNGRVLFDPTPKQLPNLPAMVQTASSHEHVVALDVHGRVWTWGASTHARLGVRAQRNPAIPGRVRGIRDAIAVAASNYASFALKADGTVWMWGGSKGGVGCWGPAWGPRGTDLRDGWPEPFQITSLTNIVQISAGHDYLVMRTRAGTVVTLGNNWFGVAGDGTIDEPANCSPRSPVTVPGLSNITYVAAGWTSAHAVTADGKLHSWGDVWGYGPIVLAPARVLVFPKPVRKVVGQGSVYALLDDGTVWGWVSNGGSVDNPAPAAVKQVPGLSAIEELAKPIEFFGHSVFARDSSGRLFAYSPNNYGELGIGVVSNMDAVATQVPLPLPVRTMSVGFFGVVAITTDSATWTWGRDGLGLLGRGDAGASAVPVPVSGLHDIRKLVVGRGSAFALDGSGRVWGWGNNEGQQMGTQARTPSSTPLQVDGGTAVVDIAASWYALVMVGSDGKVRINGPITRRPWQTEPVEGLPPITRVAGGYSQAIFLTADGELWTMGTNAWGELGDGTTTDRETPVRITGIPPVMQVVSDFRFTLALTTSGEVWGWGQNTVLGSPQRYSLVPQRLSGLSGIVEIAAAPQQALARRSDGLVLSWGGPMALGREGDSQVPAPVDGLDEVISIAVAEGASYAIRADGTVWGWGGVVCESDACPLPGDGTFVIRDRPVVVIREDGKGNLDTNDWFLDAKPGTPKKIPAAKVPKVIPITQALSSSGLLNFDASVNVRASDLGKTLGLYVLGLVPPAFLSQVPTAPGAQAMAANAKADVPILVNLTPAGWTVVSGQISALTTGTNNSFLGATGLLTNVNPATIPGARFCIGYGESATDMLRTETIRDFLSLEGATSSTLGLPCLLSGVYVDGPPTSQKGTAVPLRGVVVGQSPTGSVWFRDKFSDISAPITVSARNAAVSDVSTSYTPPVPGEYAFLARYGGDSLNVAVTSEIALRHVVAAAQTQQTTTRIDAPVSSEIGMEIRLTAVVSGNRPTGGVQFKRGVVNEGTPVPVINDQAVTTLVGLGLGDYSFTASYSGDASNQPSTSAAYSHRVLDVVTSAVALGSSANPSGLGDAITLSVTVTGTNPTGTVQLREGVTPIGNLVNLVGGKATFSLSSLTAGIHVFTVDYAGDAANPKATSNPVFQQVNLNLNPTGDLDGDGIPNAVEQQENLRPDVKDNDVFGNPRLFAMQQYRDFLGREGDAAGVSFWASQLSGNVQSRAQMVESYFKSPEFQGSASPVVRLYFAYFLRIPDYEGLTYWIGQYRAGTALQSISNAFAQSAEFSNRYGALNNTQFVNLVYANVLGRAADAAGLAFWKGQLDTNAMTRGQVMAQFSESPEYATLSTSSVYVTMMYAAMLRRSPDASGFAFWVDYLDKGNPGLALINGFLAVPEYRQRFLS